MVLRGPNGLTHDDSFFDMLKAVFSYLGDPQHLLDQKDEGLTGEEQCKNAVKSFSSCWQLLRTPENYDSWQ